MRPLVDVPGSFRPTNHGRTSLRGLTGQDCWPGKKLVSNEKPKQTLRQETKAKILIICLHVLCSRRWSRTYEPATDPAVLPYPLVPSGNDEGIHCRCHQRGLLPERDVSTQRHYLLHWRVRHRRCRPKRCRSDFRDLELSLRHFTFQTHRTLTWQLLWSLANTRAVTSRKARVAPTRICCLQINKFIIWIYMKINEIL